MTRSLTLTMTAPTLAVRTRRALARLKAAFQWMLLAPLMAILSSPAFAELPTVTAPDGTLGGGTCTDNDMMCKIGAYIRQYITYGAYSLIGIGVLVYIIFAFMQWRALTAGRIEQGEFINHLLVGAVVIAVVVILAGWGVNALKE